MGLNPGATTARTQTDMKSIRSLQWCFGDSALAFALRFVILFAIAGTVADVAVESAALAPIVDSRDEMNATIADAAARLIGCPSTRYGTVIINGAYALDITPECSGLTVSILLVCAMVAFPSRWAFKVVGCFCGTVFLFWANILRIVSLTHVGGKRPDLVAELHVYVWPAVMIAGAVVCMITWIYLGSVRVGRFSHSAKHRRTDFAKVSDQE
jgi:exosortase/archaeosortase family protein